MYKTLRLGKLEEEFEKKFNSLPQYSPLTFDKKSVTVTKKKKNSTSSPPEPPKPCKGEFTACMETDITSSWPPHSFPHLLTFLGSSHLMFRMTWLPPNIACCVVFFCSVLLLEIRFIFISEKDLIPQDSDQVQTQEGEIQCRRQRWRPHSH